MEDVAELREPLRAAVAALEELGVEFYLFGAAAQNVWGYPRFTGDADFILALPDERHPDLIRVLQRHGFSPRAASALQRLRTSRMLKAAWQRWTIDFVLGETEFERSAMGRRRILDYLDSRLPVASAEDVILHKLIAHRGQDLVDIENIVRRQASGLDRRYLRKWAAWLARETGYDRIQSTLEVALKKSRRRR